MLVRFPIASQRYVYAWDCRLAIMAECVRVLKRDLRLAQMGGLARLKVKRCSLLLSAVTSDERPRAPGPQRGSDRRFFVVQMGQQVLREQGERIDQTVARRRHVVLYQRRGGGVDLVQDVRYLAVIGLQ